MKKIFLGVMFFGVMFSALFFTACGGDKKSASEYQKETIEAICDKTFDCYPAEAEQEYGSESQCVAQGTATKATCDDIDYDHADKCLECYQNNISCNDILTGVDPCSSTPDCLHSCKD